MLLRWLSAIGGLIVLFGTLIFVGSRGLAVVGSLICLIAAIEYARMFVKISPWFFIFIITDIAVYLTQVLYPTYTLASLPAAFVLLSTLGIIIFRNREPQEILRNIQWTLWGVIYTGLFPALSVRFLVEFAPIAVIYLLVVVFFGDVAAFFCGSFIGGPKIFPNISPKKTISGAIGGLIFSAICGTLFLWYFSSRATVPHAIFLSLVIGMFAQFGDFFESLIKRVSGTKDSGQIMPGHGGLLDRLDGVYFGSAIFYTLCITLGYIDYFI